MARKRKSQKRNEQENESGLDAPSSMQSTAKPSTRSTREEGATLKAKSNVPTYRGKLDLFIPRYGQLAPTLGEHEPGDRAREHTRNQDRETAGMASADRTGDTHTSVKHDARPVSSMTTNLNTRSKPKTWASVAEHGDKVGAALTVDLTGLKERTEQLALEVQTIRNTSEKNLPTVEKDTLEQFRDFLKQERARMKLHRETTAIQDKEVRLKDLKDFSKTFKLQAPIPKDLLPILARDRLRQDHILAKSKLATNVNEQGQPSNEEEISKVSEPLPESQVLKGQEWPEKTTLFLKSSKDRQIGSSMAATSDVHGLDTTLPKTLPWPDENLQPSLPNRSVAYHDEPLYLSVRSFEPVGNWRPLAEQRNSYTLQSPSMEAMECGLGVVTHYTFPKGSFIPFQTIRNLGRGSMAHVEEVHVPRHRSFVRKTFLLTMGSDLRPRCRDIIHREIEAMRRLQHIHIVRVIGSYDLEPITSTILMSPVGDNDLKMFLDELEETPPGTREWEERRSWLWKWVGCLTSAVAYIHSQGICHKDIKPSNIVHKGDDVYLTDFSSCDQFNVGGTTSTGADARTTLVYRAPELFCTGDTGKHGPGTDIFALGLVFLEMKTVYWGTTVKRLREFYEAAASVKSAINEFYYGKVLTKIHDILSLETTRGDNRAWPLSSQVIQSMLASERKERPSAIQILDKYHLVTSDACVCTISNAISDNRFTHYYHYDMSRMPDPSPTADPYLNVNKR